jgi:uncharacterized membrane protein YkvA (DUF1232 family)
MKFKFNRQDVADYMSRKAGSLKQVLSDIKLSLSLLKDYMLGRYRNISWQAVCIILFALLYALSPLDVIPDILPMGLSDDAAILLWAFHSVKEELEHYRRWKGI